MRIAPLETPACFNLACWPAPTSVVWCANNSWAMEGASNLHRPRTAIGARFAEVRFTTATGHLEVLSVYCDEDDQTVWVDLGPEREPECEHTCCWTGLDLQIGQIDDMDMQLWKFMSVQGRELDLVQKCISNWRELFSRFDALECGKLISPPDYVQYLCAKVLMVNPHSREAVETGDKNACLL